MHPAAYFRPIPHSAFSRIVFFAPFRQKAAAASGAACEVTRGAFYIGNNHPSPGLAAGVAPFHSQPTPLVRFHPLPSFRPVFTRC